MTKRRFSVGVALLSPVLLAALLVPGCMVNTPVVDGDDAGADDAMGGAGAEGGSGGRPQAGSSNEGGSTGGVSGGGPTGGASPSGGVPSGGASPNGGASPSGGASPAGGSGGFPPGCTPQRVAGVGPCTAAFGPYFLGNTCAWLGGCSCEGEDCDDAYESEDACLEANRECLDPCRPQDATFTGRCEPLPRKVFTGVACVEMLGCECVGIDCDYTYPLFSDDPEPEPPTCEEANARCLEAPRSCDQIVATYNEYASRDACEEDEDCRLTFGHCGAGIGGCYYFMNRQWPEDGLAALAAEFEAQGCVGPICSCAAPPTSVKCDGGHCVPG